MGKLRNLLATHMRETDSEPVLTSSYDNTSDLEIRILTEPTQHQFDLVILLARASGCKQWQGSPLARVHRNRLDSVVTMTFESIRGQEPPLVAYVMQRGLRFSTIRAEDATKDLKLLSSALQSDTGALWAEVQDLPPAVPECKEWNVLDANKQLSAWV